ARLTDSEKKIVGEWQLERSFGNEETEEVRKMMEMFNEMAGPVTPECFPDKSYNMELLGVLVEGKWALDRTQVRLQIEKVGGMAPQDVIRGKSKPGVSGWNMNPSQRQEFLSSMGNSAALDNAEEMRTLKMGVDGRSLYVVTSNSNALFSSGESVFKKVVENSDSK
ncbi:MAG: hypothetical protein J0H02_04145, partial [Armatimonadetes bacterium]|nr:hypothetical protein [Armatimonadota bacterium]